MDSRPRRILVTRSAAQGSELALQLRALGMEPILIPALEIVPPTSYATLDAAIAVLSSFHWLLFTSANAVEAFAARLKLSPNGPEVLLGTGFSPSIASDKSERALAPERKMRPLKHGLKISAIGPATARALEAIGLTPTLIPPQAVAESLLEALLLHAHQPDGSPTRFLLVRAEDARDLLPDSLRAAGSEVTLAPAYRTVVAHTSLPAIRDLFSRPENYPDAITFTSSSSVRNLLALLAAAGLTLPPQIARVSIGPITSQDLAAAGLPATCEAETATVASLAKSCQALFATEIHASPTK